MRVKDLILIPLLFLALLFMSCSGSPSKADIMFGYDLISYDYSDYGYSFGFNLQYIYDSELPDISFVRFNGDNTLDLHVDFKDNANTGFYGATYKDYKFRWLSFIVDTSGHDSVEIDGIVLNINGTETTVELSQPVKYHYADEYLYDFKVFTAQAWPTVVTSANMEEPQELGLIASCSEDISITNAYFSDGLTVTSLIISYAGEEDTFSDTDEVVDLKFPIEVKAGKGINFSLTCVAENLRFHECRYDFFMEYKTADGEMLVYKNDIYFSSLGENTLESIMQHIYDVN